MGVNDFGGDIDWTDESWISMWNVSEQISEAYKEEVKKGDKQAKKSRKDEKKAKQHDMLLAKFLVKILIDKSYDKLLPSLFKAFDSWVPSNLILWIMSLVYIDISHTIRQSTGRSNISFNFSIEETLNFSGDNLPQEIKDRINSWVEDVHSVISFNPSKIYTTRVIESIKDSKELYNFSVEVFIYFLSESNIYIKPKTAWDYVGFIFQKIILPKIK